MASDGALQSRDRGGHFAGGLAFSFAIAAKFSSKAHGDVTSTFQRAIIHFGSVVTTKRPNKIYAFTEKTHTLGSPGVAESDGS